jgi:hypothetical protein
VRRLLVASMVVAALAGCGREGSDFSDQAAADLQAGVARVRAAISAGNRDQAERELAAVRGAVAMHRGQGEVGEGRAAGILAAADRVGTELARLSPPTTTTTAPPATGAGRVPTTTRERGEGEDKDKGDKGDGGKKEDD